MLYIYALYIDYAYRLWNENKGYTIDCCGITQIIFD